MQLSKSEFLMYLKHPAWLWLKKHDKKKLPAPDENLQALFDAGNEFEGYAERLFPDAKRVGFSNYNEYLSMPRRTADMIKNGTQTLFQGRFEAGNITCICDVIQKNNDDTWDLYEIKASTSAKSEHIFDLGFQTLVLEGAGYTIRNIFVIHVNRDFVRRGDVVIEKLTKTVDVTKKVRGSQDKTKYYLDKALEVLGMEEIPDISPRHARLGSLSEWLPIYYELKGEKEDYSIYDLIAPRADVLGKLEDAGETVIGDISEESKELLTEKQQRQVGVTQSGMRVVNNEKVTDFIDHLLYPLYFLDYETFMHVVPMYDGVRPYQQVPFQYSVHVKRDSKADVEHREYLHRDVSFSVPALLEKLSADIGPDGSILVWNERFEKGCNDAMGVIESGYADFMKSVNDRIVDLMLPFANGWIADKDFLGSASIKKVLPVLVPDLSYKILGIQEGGSAQRLWMDAALRGERIDEKDEIFSDLVEYCALDTFAMVRIWEELLKMIADKPETVSPPKQSSLF